ncbi:MAG: hypothetical protein NWR73_05830 [Flavobacteriales bacterium]|jgi:hypothetical protein|nr:hypothetical protein [Flavobacteriales bacterium]
MKKSHLIRSAAVIVTLLATTVSCNKVDETIATIEVRNSFGSPVAGATVRLYAVGSTDTDNIGEIRFDTTQVTNGSGKVSFNFSDFYKRGQAGFAVLDIAAEKGSLIGEGIIKIEEEKTNEEIVVIE